MKGQKRCYLGALLLKMKELALKCAGKQKQEFQVFITWFKAWGDCEQSEEQGAMWSINVSQYQTAVRPLQNKESTFWTSKYAKKTHPPRASHISGWKRLLGCIKEYLQDFPFFSCHLNEIFWWDPVRCYTEYCYRTWGLCGRVQQIISARGQEEFVFSSKAFAHTHSDICSARVYCWWQRLGEEGRETTLCTMQARKFMEWKLRHIPDTWEKIRLI